MDAEAKLAALWAEAGPPAHDPAFTLAVMARVERRKILRDVFDLAFLAVMVGLLAWAFAPAIETMVVAGGNNLDPLATTGFLAALSVLLGAGLAIAGSRGSLSVFRPS